MDTLNTIDRRTKEYKDALHTLAEGVYTHLNKEVEEEVIEEEVVNKSRVKKEDYDFLISLQGVFPRQKLGWLFYTYADVFEINFNKKVVTPYKIHKMISNLTEIYDKENK